MSFEKIRNRCGDCRACCIEGAKIMLSEVESDRLTSDGADLEQIELSKLNKDRAKHIRLQALDLGVGIPLVFSEFTSDCPNSVVDEKGRASCSIKNDPTRPIACSGFRHGSPECNLARNAMRHLAQPDKQVGKWEQPDLLGPPSKVGK